MINQFTRFTGRQLKTLCQNVVKTAKVYTLSAESQDTEQICISLVSICIIALQFDFVIHISQELYELRRVRNYEIFIFTGNFQDSFSRWVSINQSVQQQKDCQTLRSLVTG